MRLIALDGAGQTLQWSTRLRPQRARRFGFQKKEPGGSRGYHEIDFQALLVPKEIEFPAFALVHLGFDNLGCDKTYKDRSGTRGPRQRDSIFDAQQVTNQTGIEEVEFWRFNQALAEILKEGLDEHDLSCDFQDAEPLRHGRHRNAQRRGDVRLIENLARPAGQ